MTDTETDGDLEQANPIRPEELAAAVAIDRSDLLALLEADDRMQARRGGRAGGRERRRSTRAAYVGTMAAAAAIIVVLFIGGGGIVTDERAPSGPATEGAPSLPPLPEPDGAVPSPGDPSTPPTTTGAGPAVANEEPVAGVGTPVTIAPEPTPDESDPDPTEAEPTADDGPQRTGVGFDQALDLLVLHFDHADRDDVVAAAAGRTIANRLDLDLLVVNGTQGVAKEGFVHDYASAIDEIWGDEALDAGAQREAALDVSVERWLATIDGGGQVWVAEGGVSDFTAELVRRIQAERPGLDLTGVVHVVQHSNRNQTATNAEDLALVQASLDYQRIDDGNGLNGTADLHMPSERFRTAALAGPEAEGWQAAFDYHRAVDLDFSDTVAVLHILGIGVEEIADPDDFARVFLE